MPENKQIQKIEGTLHRSALVERSVVDAENRTVEVAFSSEEPYLRWWGYEILDHSPQAVDLSRMNNGGAVLVDHDHRTQVGVVEKAWVDSDRKARALVRFGKSDRAEQELQDIADGIRRHVSVGYQIEELVLEKADKEADTYRVIKWLPYEISFVAVPADPTVGVGRSAEEKEVKLIFNESEETRMAANPTTVTPAAAPAQPAAPAVDSRELERIREEARRNEEARVREISAMGEKFNLRELAQEHIAKGTSVDAFARAILDQQGNPKVVRLDEKVTEIGMSEKEKKRYSILRAMRALVDARDGKSNAWKEAGLELEASRAVGQKLGREAQGFFLPTDVLMAQRSFAGALQVAQALQRDLTVGTASAGGHTVATNLLAANFIDLLRDAMVVMGLGVQTLSGLVGNIAIPRQTGAATAYWVAESGAPTESQQAFDQVPMSPKTVGAFTDISRKLLLQSSIDVENFVMMDLARVLGLALQQAIISGSGTSNQPTGILSTVGIGSVPGGTNGAAPTYDHVVDLETEVAVDNALLGNLAYLTNHKVRGKLKKTLESATAGANYVWRKGMVNDYTASVTNAVPSNLTKGTANGVCSAIIFGNWADVIMGLWGGLDITNDPYTNSTSGTVRIVTLQDADVAVRHAQSFAAMVDALTT